jgi:hypothetical protein
VQPLLCKNWLKTMDNNSNNNNKQIMIYNPNINNNKKQIMIYNDNKIMYLHVHYVSDSWKIYEYRSTPEYYCV